MRTLPKAMAAILLAFAAARICAAPLAHLTTGPMVASFDARGYFRIMYKGVTIVPQGQIYLADKGWGNVYPSRHGRNFDVKVEGDDARKTARIVARKNLFNDLTLDCTVERNRVVINLTRKVLPETETGFAVVDIFLSKPLLTGAKFAAKRKASEKKGTIDPAKFGDPVGRLQSLHLDTYVGGIDIALGAEAPPSAWQFRSVCDRKWGAEELQTFSLLSCYSSVPKTGTEQHLTFELTIEESPEIDAVLYRRSIERGVHKLHDAVAAQRKRLGMPEPAALAMPRTTEEIAALQNKLMAELDSLCVRRGRFIVPQPQHVQWGKGAFKFTPNTHIFLNPRAGIGAQRAAKVITRELGKLGLKLSTAATASDLASTALVVGDKPVAAAVDASLPAEGYTLSVTPAAIALAGRDDHGTFYAAQSLVQIVEQSADRVVTAPAVSVRDWPDLKQRGIHIWGFGSDATVDDVKRTITDIAARYKLNMFAFGSSYPAFHWRSHPEIRTKPGGITMEQLGEIAQLARDNFMEFVPAFESYGHLNSLFASHPEIAECWKPGKRYNSYCPSNPKSYELIFDLFQEVVDATHPKTFHIGHDEISGIGTCDKCKATPPYVLLANDITKIHDWLKARGIQTLLWGDMLLDNNVWAKTGIGAHNSNRSVGATNTHLALDLLPKDVIIADWHYSGVKEFGSLAHFRDKGFHVLACPWYGAKNNNYFALSAAKAKIDGMLLTDWGFLSTLSAAGTSVLGMEYAWTPGKPELDALPYYPPEILADQLRPRRPSDAPGARFAPVDIAALANARSTANGVTDFESWFGLGGTMDSSLLSRGKRTMAGIAFDLLPPSANDCVMFGGKDAKPLPTEIARIPLGRRARSVVFLQAMSTTDPGVWHKPVAKYVFHYADGTRAEAEVKENREVTHWLTYQQRTNPWHWREGNADLYGAKCAWRGFTRAGDAINLQAYEWVNPQPDKALSYVQLTALEHREALKIAVLAVTCVE